MTCLAEIDVKARSVSRTLLSTLLFRPLLSRAETIVPRESKQVIRTENRPSTPEEWRRAGDLVVGVVARAFMVPTVELRATSRSRQPVAYARQAALYLLHVVFGGTYQEAGSALGRERTTVAYACSLIEDDRDDVAFDRKLSHLEEWIERLWSVEQLRMLRRIKRKQEARAAA